MKRTIKFRGQQTHDNDWFEGSLISLENGKNYITQDLRTPQERNQKTGHTLAHFSEVIPETIGQFTGLTDKNGKEIYEGDIFKLSDEEIRYLVEWHDTGFSGRQYSKLRKKWSANNSWVGLLGYCKNHIEVIGNIHDNPELLK